MENGAGVILKKSVQAKAKGPMRSDIMQIHRAAGFFHNWFLAGTRESRDEMLEMCLRTLSAGLSHEMRERAISILTNDHQKDSVVQDDSYSTEQDRVFSR